MIIFIITNINSAGCVAVAQAVEAAARAELLQVRNRDPALAATCDGLWKYDTAARGGERLRLRFAIAAIAARNIATAD